MFIGSAAYYFPQTVQIIKHKSPADIRSSSDEIWVICNFSLSGAFNEILSDIKKRNT